VRYISKDQNGEVMTKKQNQINVTIDSDLLPKLKEAKKKIKEETGFEPTHSQTIKYLLHNYKIKQNG
jgi:hypothetical protein|tara:strand:+ start:39 stop:239 length:201 start_codon:yes stop_codon:yes gene_type:complete